MVYAWISALLIAVSSLVAYADDIVSEFSCIERSTGLEVSGAVTQSSREAWRFFMDLQSSNGSSATYEARSFTGFDYDSMESLNGYNHYSKDGNISYEERSKAGRTKRFLFLKKAELTGDRADHELTCTSTP